MSDNILRSQLNGPVRRLIKEKELYLEKKCRRIWEFTNHLQETFLFANFSTVGNPQDKTIVTLAHYEPSIHNWIPSR